MQTRPSHINVLVIEDNPADFTLIEIMLRASGIGIDDIIQAHRVSEAKAFLEKNPIGLVLLDLSLPDSFGIASFQQLKPFTQHIPVIILTGVSESSVALEALQQGAQDYLVKGEIKKDILARAINYSIERKNVEKVILASEDKYRQMFYKNPFPAWIYDYETLHILEVNDAAIQRYGYSREEFFDLTIIDIRPSDEVPSLRQSIAHRHEPQKWANKIWKHQKKNGEIMLVEVTSYQIDYRGKIAMQAQMNDVTEKFRLEQELAAQQKAKQQQITQAILDTQEEERSILGAELHDNINQILATAQLFLSSASNNPSHMAELFTKSRSYIVAAINEIRKLSKNLVTPVFISTGFKRAIESLGDDIQKTKEIEFVTELEALEDPILNDEIKLNIYRIVQEQLNNILKHANASRVYMNASIAGNDIKLVICDNGKGFDTSNLTNGIGLLNIQNRADLFNGRIEIDSSPGNGCRLCVYMNIKTEKEKVAA